MSMFLKDTPGRTAIHDEDFFSVAIVSFNRFHKLEKLINSIHQHADMPFEIVVSDDGGALYDNFDFVSDFRPKISHIAVNLGRNKGLHVNANTAVSMTRSKYCLIINDDLVITKPFMRACVNILKHAKYINSIYLESSLSAPTPNWKEPQKVIECLAPTGEKYGVGYFVGSSSPVFRKEYWYEVGGYQEDQIYGDLPFNVSGFYKGYMSASLAVGPCSFDTDKDHGPGGSKDSSGEFIDVGYANYPKIFKWSEQKRLANDLERAGQCSQRSGNNALSGDFNLNNRAGWYDFMNDIVLGGEEVNWSALKEKFNVKHLESLKRDHKAWREE